MTSSCKQCNLHTSAGNGQNYVLSHVLHFSFSRHLFYELLFQYNAMKHIHLFTFAFLQSNLHTATPMLTWYLNNITLFNITCSIFSLHTFSAVIFPFIFVSYRNVFMEHKFDWCQHAPQGRQLYLQFQLCFLLNPLFQEQYMCHVCAKLPFHIILFVQKKFRDPNQWKFHSDIYRQFVLYFYKLCIQ